MVGLLASACRFIRACLPVVLALHLAVAQAVMLPAAAGPVQPQVDLAASDAQASAMHCHDMEAMAPVTATPTKPVPSRSSSHCEPGHCHCPVAMAQELRLAAAPVAFIRRVDPGAALPGIPSLRQAPDLRPPIAP